MHQKKDHIGRSNWTSTYTKLETPSPNCVIGDSGEKIVRYLVKRYPEIAQKFFNSLNAALPEFQKELIDVPNEINSKRLMTNLTFKRNFLEALLDRQRGDEEEYDD